MSVVSGIALGGGVLIALLAALLVLGIVLLFRRRGAPSATGLAPLTLQAGTLLVQLDDTLRGADDELGFAVAQFGAERAKPYAAALAEARAKVTEAFRLRQALDDAHPESDTTRREWTLQIIALCEQASQTLQTQDAAFTRLRGLEVTAATTAADQTAYREQQSREAAERAQSDRAAATAALTELRTKTKADIAEAVRQADAAPDAETGAKILAAIAAADTAVTRADTAHPLAALDTIGDAVAALDLALASARNQAQRLEHARTAYTGTLISAQSQIAAVHELIGSQGGGVDSRTRLSEAERQLMLAKNETDPVTALDTVRRAVTLARDADALARYDALGARS